MRDDSSQRQPERDEISKRTIGSKGTLCESRTENDNDREGGMEADECPDNQMGDRDAAWVDVAEMLDGLVEQ
jgi:hypothetical protein